MPFKRTVCILAGTLAMTAGVLNVSPASADQTGGGDANVKSMSFDARSVNTTLHVISTDGEKWDKLKSGNVEFWGHMKLDTRWPGYTYEVGVVLGACGGGLCQSFPVLFYAQPASRDYNHQTNFSFSSSKIPVSTTGIALLSYGDSIIGRCNEHLQPDGPTKSYSFTYEMHATFVANTGGYIHNTDNILYEAGDGPVVEYVDEARKDSFEIQVVCDPVIKPPTDDLSFDHGEFDVENVKLFLTTINTLDPEGANPATVCPVLRVTARAEANQQGPVTMRIWEQLDGGAITSRVEQAWASYDAAKNGYFATYQEHRNFGVTTHAQYRVEIIDNSTFPPFDGWKEIMVHCTGAGGGGLTTVPPRDPDLPAPQANWDGEIVVADSASAGGDKSCPRKGQAFFAATREGPGDFDYRISCSNGASFNGTATGFDKGNGLFQAFGTHELSVNRTRAIQCTLQELTASGSPVTVDVHKTEFTCANPTFDPPSDDLTSDPRPQPLEPKTPVAIVDPAPNCSAGLKFLNGRCVREPFIVPACKQDEIRTSSGRCAKKPTVSILCKPGYTLVRGDCVRQAVVVPPKRVIMPERIEKPAARVVAPQRTSPPHVTTPKRTNPVRVSPPQRSNPVRVSPPQRTAPVRRAPVHKAMPRMQLRTNAR